MRGPRFVARILNAICLFSFHSLKSENTAYLLPFNSPPAPVIDNDLPYERYSETVQRLRSLFPPACPSFEPGEVTLDVETPIAAGGFADTWQGTCGGHRVVQKTYRCYETGDAESTFRRYLSEVWVLTQLYHLNIVRFLGINPASNHPFSLVLDTGDNLDLREYLHKHTEVDELKLVLGIAHGLKHVHDLEIVHGHLAPHNILVNSDGTPRITGFDSSFMISRPDLWPGDAVSFFRGIAPEVIRPQKTGGNPTVRITKSSDMYAFGMLTWQIFSRKEPFSGDLDVTVIRRLVLKGDRPSRPHHAGLSNRMWKMVKACWNDLPSRRLKVDEVVALIEAELHPPVRIPGRPI